MTAKVDLTPSFPPCFHPRLPHFSGDVTDVTVENKTTVYACAREEGEERRKRKNCFAVLASREGERRNVRQVTNDAEEVRSTTRPYCAIPYRQQKIRVPTLGREGDDH